MKKIKIILLPDGTQRIEVVGAVGDECVSFTAALEERLGNQVGERELKPEYDEPTAEAEPELESGV